MAQSILNDKSQDLGQSEEIGRYVTNEIIHEMFPGQVIVPQKTLNSVINDINDEEREKIREKGPEFIEITQEKLDKLKEELGEKFEKKKVSSPLKD